jgi:hypothetical protein
LLYTAPNNNHVHKIDTILNGSRTPHRYSRLIFEESTSISKSMQPSRDDQLVALHNKFISLERDVQQLKQDSIEFQQTLTAQMTQFQQYTTTQLALSQQGIAKSCNASAIYPADTLAIVPRQNGQNPPAIYPGTMKELREISRPACGTLLAFYGHQAQGTEDDCLQALAIILGVRGHLLYSISLLGRKRSFPTRDHFVRLQVHCRN